VSLSETLPRFWNSVMSSSSSRPSTVILIRLPSSSRVATYGIRDDLRMNSRYYLRNPHTRLGGGVPLMYVCIDIYLAEAILHELGELLGRALARQRARLDAHLYREGFT